MCPLKGANTCIKETEKNMITEFESFSTIVSSTGKRTQQLVGPSYEIRLNQVIQ
jgi:hypothetical protein